MTGDLVKTQRLALALDRNLSVSAGAGTGKTRVLVARCLAIFRAGRFAGTIGARAGARPSGIVAVTFTRKAANEMRERLLEAVSKEILAARRLPDEDSFRYWNEVRRTLDDALITTIHGLAARIVRESALELGVDPRFRILEPMDEARLMAEAVAQALESPPRDARDGLVAVVATRSGPQLRALLETLIRDRQRANEWSARLIALEDEEIMDVLWREVPVEPADSERLIAQACALFSGLPPSAVAADLPQKTQDFLGCVEECEAARGAPHATRVLALWRLLKHATREAGGLYTGPHYALGKKDAWARMGGVARQQEVFDGLNALLEPLVGRLRGVPGDADRRLLHAMRAVALAYRDALQRYERLKRERGAHDYTDLELYAVEALSRGHIAERYRRRFRYVLVDEFQDTNDAQWRIVRSLAAPPLALQASPQTPIVAGAWQTMTELEEGAPVVPVEPARVRTADELLAETPTAEDGDSVELAEDRLFIVGDTKQSIYAFRGADVQVYNRSRDAVLAANAEHGIDPDCVEIVQEDGRPREEPGASTAGEIALDTNFRSLPGLVRFTNRLFEELLRPEDDAQGRQPFEAEPGSLKAHRLPLADGTSGTVRFLVSASHLEGAVNLGHLTQAEAEVTDSVRYTFRRLAADIAARVGPASMEPYMVAKKEEARAAGAAEPARQAQFGDVLILLPRMTHLGELEEALTAQGIPYVVARGRGFWSRQEVWDVVNLLAVLAAPRRDIALLGVLRSPFFAWSDAAFACLPREGASLYARLRAAADKTAPWTPPLGFAGMPPADVVAALRRWRRRARATSAARLVEEILAETAYKAALAPDRRATQAVYNLDRLVARIRDMEQEDGVHLPLLARRLEALVDAGEDEREAVLPPQEDAAKGAVQVMTVHSAKGLEFPVVYLAELDAEFQSGVGGRLKGVVAAELAGAPFLAMKVRGPTGEPEDSFALRLVRERQSMRDRAEMKRVLYVAVTRAKDHLVLCGRSDRIAAAKKAPDLKPVSASRSWIDWLERLAGLSEAAYQALGSGAAGPLYDDGTPWFEVDARPVAARVAAPTAAADAAEAIKVAPRLPVIAQKVALTPSAVEVAALCRARFRYRVIDGLPELRLPGTEGGAPDYGARFGSWLHRALAMGATSAHPVPERLAARVRGEVEAWRKAGAAWPSAETALENLREHSGRAVAALEPFPVVMVEHDVDARVAPAVRVFGRLDRLHVDADGRLFVLDLKTDQVASGAEREHARSKGYLAQVALYDRVLSECGFETAAPRLLYSATGAIVVAEERPDPVVEEVVARLDATASALAGLTEEDAERLLERDWPRTTVAKHCASCPYWARHGGPCAGAVTA